MLIGSNSKCWYSALLVLMRGKASFQPCIELQAGFLLRASSRPLPTDPRPTLPRAITYSRPWPASFKSRSYYVRTWRYLPLTTQAIHGVLLGCFLGYIPGSCILHQHIHLDTGRCVLHDQWDQEHFARGCRVVSRVGHAIVPQGITSWCVIMCTTSGATLLVALRY